MRHPGTPRDPKVSESGETTTVIAWPRFLGPELDSWFETFGSVLAETAGLQVLFYLDASVDPDRERAAEELAASFERSCAQEVGLDATILQGPLLPEQWDVLSKTIAAQAVSPAESRYLEDLPVPIIRDGAGFRALMAVRGHAESPGLAQHGASERHVSDAMSPKGEEPDAKPAVAFENRHSSDARMSPRQQLPVSRVVIMDPGLFSTEGHHFNSDHAYLDELKRLHLESLLIFHKDASPEVRGLGGRPYFSVSGYATRDHVDRASELEDLVISNAVFFNQLRKLKPLLDLRPSDMVFFPGVTAHLVLAISQFIATFSPPKTPKFALCFLVQMDWHSTGRVSHVGRTFYESALGFLPDEMTSSIVATCETEDLAREYEPLLDTQPLVAPIPTLQGRIWAQQQTEPGGSPTLSFLGWGKREKGVHLMPEVVDLVSAKRPDLNFIVHLLGPDAGLLNQVRSALLPHGERVRIIEGSVEPEELVDLLLATNLMILPYDPNTYRSRGSGIFSECKSAGIPMVLPAKTSIGEEGLVKGFGVTFGEHSAESVASAALDAVDRIEELRDAAGQERRGLQASEVGYIQKLLERL